VYLLASGIEDSNDIGGMSLNSCVECAVNKTVTKNIEIEFVFKWICEILFDLILKPRTRKRIKHAVIGFNNL
jgi:hypothetical protein